MRKTDEEIKERINELENEKKTIRGFISMMQYDSLNYRIKELRWVLE